MRARTREVQIFNMSLIDILCGALGAFCFMMLVLLPYYKPPGKASDLYKQQAQTQDLLKDAEKFTGAETNPAQVQQMAEMLRRLEEQIKQLQGQVNQFAAQNQQLQSENDSLTKQNQQQAKTISQRRPFLTMIATDPRQSIDVYLQDDFVSPDKHSNPPFDPSQPHHNTFWPGDINSWIGGVASWVVRDSPPNIHYKVYAQLANQPSDRVSSSVQGIVVGENQKWVIEIPPVTLTPARFWTLMGTLTGGADGTVSFQSATQAERDAEWSKLSKSPPPPEVKSTATSAPIWPFSSPAVQPSASTISPEEQERRKRLVDEMDRARKKAQEQRQQSATPSTSP